MEYKGFTLKKDFYGSWWIMAGQNEAEYAGTLKGAKNMVNSLLTEYGSQAEWQLSWWNAAKAVCRTKAHRLRRIATRNGKRILTTLYRIALYQTLQRSAVFQ